MHDDTDMEIREMNFASRTLKCRNCGKKCSRHSRKTRRIKDVSQSKLHPVILTVTVGMYWCSNCEKFFSNDLSHLAPKGGKYTHRVMEAVMHHLKDKSLKETRKLVYDISCVNVPLSTLHDIKSGMDYALASGIEADPRSMGWRNGFNKIQRIRRRDERMISECFDISGRDEKRLEEKKIKYDFPGRKGIIPEGAALAGGTVVKPSGAWLT